MKRYTLVYVPKYKLPRVASFVLNKDGSKTIKEIEMNDGYTQIPTVKEAKYNLYEIDALTSKYDSIYSFLEAYGVKLYAMATMYADFISYKTGEFTRSLQPVFDNKYISDLIESGKVVNDKVNDNIRITYMSNKFLNDEKFLNQFLRGNYACQYRLRKALEYARMCKKYGDYDSEELNQELYYSESQIKSNLTRYQNYREALRCLKDYEDAQEKAAREAEEKAKHVEVEEPKTPRVKIKKNIDGQEFFPGFNMDE